MAKSAQHDDDSARDDEFADADLSEVKRKARSTPSAKRPAPTEEAAPEESSEGFSVTIDSTMLRRAATVVGALAVVALLGVGVWQWYSARQEVRAFSEVKAAASHFIVTSIEYTSSDKADKATEVQGPLVTGKMRDELSQDRTEATKAVKDQGIKATAKVDSVGVERIDGDEATTLMIVTATGTSKMSPTPQKRTVALRLNLRREGGKWLVAESKGVGDFSPGGVNPGAPSAPGAPAPAPN